MMPFLWDLALRATVLMALGWLAALACARFRAAVRHAIWAATFAGLLALPVGMALLPTLLLPVGAAAVPGSVPTEAISSAASAFAEGGGAAPLPPPRRSQDVPWGLGASVLWLAGAVAFFGGLARESWTVRSLVRRARGRDALVTAAVRVPQVVGVGRGVILLPPSFADEPADRQQAILQHERAHIARRDCFWLLLARAGCALYWWHPLAWIGARSLRAAGEQATDDCVLACGEMPPTDYAGHLVASARAAREAVAFAGAMAATSHLEQRVRAILDPARRRQPLGVAGAAALAALLTACLVPLAAMQVVPQAGPVPTAGLPSFEAASVHPTGPMIGEHNSEHSDPVHLAISGSLHRLIVYAYGITDGEISAEPGWFRGEGWTISAVTSKPTTEAEKMLMLRRLLAERFQLALAVQTKLVPMYGLEVVHGATFKPLAAGERPPKDPPEPPGMVARCTDSIPALLEGLNGVYGSPLHFDRKVIDRTGLTGRYALCFTTARVEPKDAGPNRLQFPNLAADIEAQLGLRLVPVKAPETIYVVTHAAKPAAN